MAGQRIDREKKTIRSMISLYQRPLPRTRRPTWNITRR